MKIRGTATIKRWGKDDMSQRKNKDSFPKKLSHVQNPTEFDYYQRGLHGKAWDGLTNPGGICTNVFSRYP